MARITGIGGIFFKSPDPAGLARWYREVLGVATEDWNGALLRSGTPAHPPYTVWAPFEESTDYFAPSSREFMINFAVDDLAGYLDLLRGRGVDILDAKMDDPNGKFAWIVDPAGTKIELWEPVR
jgi:predicted enzyme related to lactoylglutathione lyase